MESIRAEVREKDEDMEANETMHYEEQQRQLQSAYVAGKQQRTALAHAEVQLGALALAPAPSPNPSPSPSPSPNTNTSPDPDPDPTPTPNPSQVVSSAS